MGQGDRGIPGVLGPSGPPGIGLYGPKVSVCIQYEEIETISIVFINHFF